MPVFIPALAAGAAKVGTSLILPLLLGYGANKVRKRVLASSVKAAAKHYAGKAARGTISAGKSLLPLVGISALQGAGNLAKAVGPAAGAAAKGINKAFGPSDQQRAMYGGTILDALEGATGVAGAAGNAVGDTFGSLTNLLNQQRLYGESTRRLREMAEAVKTMGLTPSQANLARTMASGNTAITRTNV